tara:strand:- start:565 stop:930 length:366 start_codon:yes stop_codon:yes gene_type:complete
MSITSKENGRRIWSKKFLELYSGLNIEERYKYLVMGLEEAGFKKVEYIPTTPLNRVTDLKLESVQVRLYLVELNKDHVICYRVGLIDYFDHEDTDTIFELSLNMIWDDIRRSWKLKRTKIL